MSELYQTGVAFIEEHQSLLTVVAIISAAMLLLSALGGLLLAVKLPAEMFSDDHQPKQRRLWWRILKNALGVLIILMGIAMLVLPGQGLLTILMGLLLVDIPGKRGVQSRLLHHPRVLGPLNRLRRRFGREEIAP